MLGGACRVWTLLGWTGGKEGRVLCSVVLHLHRSFLVRWAIRKWTAAPSPICVQALSLLCIKVVEPCRGSSSFYSTVTRRNAQRQHRDTALSDPPRWSNNLHQIFSLYTNIRVRVWYLYISRVFLQRLLTFKKKEKDDIFDIVSADWEAFGQKADTPSRCTILSRAYSGMR